jgi:selenide,water dikinase
MILSESPARLTQYSRGAGCGCKIAPKVLEEILADARSFPDHKQLLVGNEYKDDAAVFDLGNGTALISTTDFFSPIVDDPVDYGRIAAANALSDVYAMGGQPILAIAVLGWPVEQLPLSWVKDILKGAREICNRAGIPLAGGHSIDTPEPVFGLAVNGLVPIPHLKRNNTAQCGDWIILTKPLGLGILSTAQKRGVLQEVHQEGMISWMTTLNASGQWLGKLPGVHALTDVTGFGLLGHVLEMAEGSGLHAELYYSGLPVASGVREYIAQRIFPDATTRNWSSLGSQVKFDKGVPVMEAFTLLSDPQTNGGLLLAVAPEALGEVTEVLKKFQLDVFAQPIGKFLDSGEKTIVIQPGG